MQRDYISPRSGKEVARTFGVPAGKVRDALARLQNIGLQEERDGVDPEAPHWRFMSAYLAHAIARLIVGPGRNPEQRAERRGLELLIEATTQMQRADLDRKTAMYLGGLLLGLLPRSSGRSISGITELDQALGVKRAVRMQVVKAARRFFVEGASRKDALWKAMCEAGENPRDIPGHAFDRLLKRVSDRPEDA